MSGLSPIPLCPSLVCSQPQLAILSIRAPNCQPRPYLAIRSPNQDLMSCKILATWSLALECEEMVSAQEKNQRLENFLEDRKNFPLGLGGCRNGFDCWQAAQVLSGNDELSGDRREGAGWSRSGFNWGAEIEPRPGADFEF